MVKTNKRKYHKRIVGNLWNKKYGTPEQELEQSEREYLKLEKSLGSYDRVERQDAKDIGTKDYKGVAHFWHPDYKYPMTVDATMKQRRDVHNQYIQAGLELDGKSEKHGEIMDNVMVAGGRFIKDTKTGNLFLKLGNTINIKKSNNKRYRRERWNGKVFLELRILSLLNF